MNDLSAVFSATSQNQLVDFYLLISLPSAKSNNNNFAVKRLPRNNRSNLVNNFYRQNRNTNNQLFINAVNRYIKLIWRKRYGWKRITVLERNNWFRRRFRRWFSRYRNINNNSVFSNLFRGHLISLTSYSENEIFVLWQNFYSSYLRCLNSAVGCDVVSYFAHSFLLSPRLLSLVLGLAQTLDFSNLLANWHGFTINGANTNLPYYINVGDIVQYSLLGSLINHANLVLSYQATHSQNVLRPAPNIFQLSHTLFLASLLNWPALYDITAPSFLSQRWIRYLIAQFPRRWNKYRNSNEVWPNYNLLTALRHRRNIDNALN